MVKLNKYLPFALIYFFLNSVGLPFGITWVALLGPLFYVWVLLKRKNEIFLPFLLLFLPFVFFHFFLTGVNVNVYLLSFLNLVLIYFFCQAAYTFFRYSANPEIILRPILVLNFILCLVAIVFYFTPYSRIFWIQQNITDGVERFRRLKMLTYEASHYAMIFVPVFVFYFLQYIFRQNRINSGLLLCMLFLPLALSFSMGVIAALLVSGFVTFAIYFRRLAAKRRLFNILLYTAIFSGFFISVLFLFFRDNALLIRLVNVLSGTDTSTQGRTTDAFMLAVKILRQKNEYWGIGLGQLKVIGQDIIRAHYRYGPDIPVAIPNAAAETLLLFGWIGFYLRLFVQLVLFFHTKVWTNYYRLVLFLFIFIYQFTGSFITNPAEYVIWILAFTNVFHQFDVKRDNQLALPDRQLQPS